MNVLITLPKDLINQIIAGEKQFEMRKCVPKNMIIGQDGFFAVEKGTKEVRCWCRVDDIYSTYINYFNSQKWAPRLCIPLIRLINYAKHEKVYMWKIGKVIEFECLCRESLMVDKNPQQFVYTPLSYGESY